VDKRKYKVSVMLECELTVDEAVLKEVLTPQWRSAFYQLMTREQVVEHLVYNLVQGRPLQSLDGFGHLRTYQAGLEKVDWLDWDVKEEK